MGLPSHHSKIKKNVLRIKLKSCIFMNLKI